MLHDKDLRIDLPSTSGGDQRKSISGAGKNLLLSLAFAAVK